MDRAPVEGDEPEGPSGPSSGEEAPSGPLSGGDLPDPGGNGAKGGLAARLSKAGPVVGVREAYQRAMSKVTPSATAVVIEPDATPAAEPGPKYLGDGLDEDDRSGDQIEVFDDVMEVFDDGAAEELPEEVEDELEVEAAELAPVVVLPDPEDADEAAADLAEDEHETVTVVVLPDEEAEPASVVTARRVRRVVRRIDPISVFKLSAAFYLCLFVIFLIAGVLLWSMAVGSGSIDNIESFIVDVGFEDFKFVGDDMMRGFVYFGFALMIIGTLVNTLLAVLFNLISDLVGGIRYTVIEAEPTTPTTT